MAIATAVVLILGACSKGEPEKMQSRPATAAPVAPVPAGTEAAPAQYAPGEALKERLARQEAAAEATAKRLDAPKPQPAPARAAEPPKAPPAKAPEPVKAAPPPPAAAKAAPAKAPEVVAVAAPVASPPAKPEPAKVEPPPVAVAKLQPAALRLVQRVEPEFPREALQAGADKGLVTARMTLDEHGGVTRVEVLEARPRRLFDRAVIRALSQWKYNDGAAGRTVEIEIAFTK
jgi:protein TonB